MSESILPLRYKYITTCGEGSAGTVFKVYDIVTEETRALKTLKGISAPDKELFAAEFRILSQLHHPNLVQVHDFGTLVDGSLYFTMDYVDGVPINDVCKNYSLQQRLEVFSKVCIPILNAIEYVHAAGRIHGDIKPSNILIDTGNDGHVHVVDFGIAALQGNNDGISGTLEYLAPEVLQGGHLGIHTDIYSLGVLFYELLTGELPFKGSPDDIVKGHVHTLAPLASSQNKFIPRFLDEIIEKMLHKEEHRRWQTVQGIEQALSKEFHSEDQAEQGITHSWIPGKMYGRESELSQLLQARDRAKRQTCIVRLTGEAGIGKTRLLKEFAVDAMIAGCTVVQMQVRERDTVKDIVFRMRAQIMRTDDAHKNTDALPYRNLEELYIVATELLLQTASAGETIIITDGMDSADSSVRSFVNEILIRITGGNHICFIWSERTAKKEDGTSFDEDIKLSGIDPSFAEELFREYFGAAAFAIPLAQRLCSLTKGNVGVMIDSLRFYNTKQDIYLGKTGWSCSVEPATITIPSDIGEVLLRSYDASGVLTMPHIPEILSLVALGWENANATSIGNMLGLSEQVITGDVERLCAVGMLKEFVDGETTVAFTSPALQEAFMQTISKEEVRQFHHQWAEYLRSKGVSERSYASHYYCAHEYDMAAPAMEKAGDIYSAEFSYRNAANNYAGAIESLRKIGPDNATKVAAVQLKLAEAYGMAGDRAAEGEALQDAVVHASGMQDKKILAEAYLREAQYYNITGDFERASFNAGKGRSIAEEEGSEIVAARCEAATATSFHRRGEIQKFLEHARKSVEMFEHAGATEDAASVLLDIGFAHMLFLGDPALALNEFERAKVAFERVRMSRGTARAMGSMGLAYYWLGRYEDSMRSQEAAHEIFSQIHDMRGQVNALTNLSRVYLTAAQYLKGIHAAQTAIDLIKKVRDRFAEQKVMETLGAIYERLGSYERARDFLARSYTLAQEIGNRAAEASSLQLMGILMIHREQFDHALVQLQRAQEIADAMNETDAQTSVHLWYAELYLRQPVPDPKKAQEHVIEAEKISAAGGKKGRETALLQLRTRIALMEGNLADARRYASESVRLANTLQHSDDALHNIWLYHFKVYERSGDYATAKQSLEKAYALLMESANAIDDEPLKRSYLEYVGENHEILEAYRRINREPLNVIPATNELMLRRLYGVSRALNSVLDLDEVLNRLVDNAIEVLRAERGLIFLYNEIERKLRVAVARNVDKSTIEDASKISEGILNDVFQRGKPIVTLNAGGDERFRGRPSVVNFRLTTVFCVPLVLREKIIGTVYVDSRSIPSGVEDNATTIEFLEAFANLAAVAIENARLHGSLREENIYLRKEIEERYAFENIIGNSLAMKRVYELMRGAIRGDSPVLLEGESGTGKELIARAIHFNGKRKTKQFIAVDCGALPETLLDSELFGHKKGAFTGATEDKTGLFEEGNGGTVFLDEITNTTGVFQAKLLRVVQEGEIRRVGDTVTRTVDVRIIAATNKLLQNEVQEQRFREDLYYRLNVIPIHIPSLRERREDIPYLVEYFIKRYAEQLQSPVRNISGELMDIFGNAEWRGNVRELENTLHRMLIFADSEVLTSKNLPSDYPYKENGGNKEKHLSQIILKNDHSARHSLNNMLKEHITAVLRSTAGNKTEAAKVLGIKRTTLIQKMKKLKMM